MIKYLLYYLIFHVILPEIVKPPPGFSKPFTDTATVDATPDDPSILWSKLLQGRCCANAWGKIILSV